MPSTSCTAKTRTASSRCALLSLPPSLPPLCALVLTRGARCRSSTPSPSSSTSSRRRAPSSLLPTSPTPSLKPARPTSARLLCARFSTRSASTCRTSRCSRCVFALAPLAFAQVRSTLTPLPPLLRLPEQDYQRQLQMHDVLTQDQIHSLFINLNKLADFQRRFLIGVEGNASLAPEQQRFGNLFLQMVRPPSLSDSCRARRSALTSLVLPAGGELRLLRALLRQPHQRPGPRHR